MTVALFSASLLLIPADVPASSDGGLPPNIVLIVADDLGYGELGCQNAGREYDIPTPHMDALAASGVRFTSGYVAAPNCSPSRAGLMTGMFPTRFGYEFNPVGPINERPGVGLPPRTRTLPELLRDAGYATGILGKWHLGGAADFHPLRHGFDEFYGFLHEGHYFVPPPYDGVATWLRRRSVPGDGPRWSSVDGTLWLSDHLGRNEPDYDANNPILRGSQPVAEAEYLTDAIAREAVAFIERQAPQSLALDQGRATGLPASPRAARPFFLSVDFNAVHSPIQSRLDDLPRVAHIPDAHRRLFAGMLVRLDDAVGRITEAIDRHGIREQTAVVFLSDNGGPTRELTSSNAPLRGGKSDMYEGGIRVPFLLRWPGVVSPGSTEDRPVHAVDLFPTFVVAAGAEVPPRVDGVDLRPLLTGSAAQERTLYWRQGGRAALRSGDWKLVRGGRRNRAPGPWELYDLSADPSEGKDLAGANPDVASELIAEWERLNSQMLDPIFAP